MRLDWVNADGDECAYLCLGKMALQHVDGVSFPQIIPFIVFISRSSSGIFMSLFSLYIFPSRFLSCIPLLLIPSMYSHTSNSGSYISFVWFHISISSMYPLLLYVLFVVPTILHLHICYQLFSVITVDLQYQSIFGITSKHVSAKNEHKVTDVYKYRYESCARIHIFC